MVPLFELFADFRSIVSSCMERRSKYVPLESLNAGVTVRDDLGLLGSGTWRPIPPVGDGGRETLGELGMLLKSYTEFAADIIGDDGLVEAALGPALGLGLRNPPMIDRLAVDALLIVPNKPVPDGFCATLSDFLIDVEYSSSRPKFNTSFI